MSPATVEPSRVRTRLAAGEVVAGCFVRSPDAGLAELLALRGLDFVIVDGEHGPLTPHACEHMARAVQLHGAAPGVRVEENRASSISRYLDAGALICHVPGIESRADALRAVRAVKYRPQGDRGLAAVRSSGYGPADGYRAYVAAANRNTVVVAHIESAVGVDAAAKIAAVDGVDVLLVGTLDLSHDLGLAGEVEHPEVMTRVSRVAAAAMTAGKALGAVATDAGSAQRWIERGARYLLGTTESFLTFGVSRFLDGMRSTRGAEE